jgi:3'(2'), 5'-bisphosphate nucleotidase
MSSPYQREREVAVTAVREAARLCQAVQASLSTDALEKQDRSPVTVADFGSQALVCRVLQEAFPDDPIMAEEDAALLRADDHAEVRDEVVRQVQARHPEADADAVCDWIDAGNLTEQRDRFWTLDPIDGTKGFLRGDQYAVALALLIDDVPTVAALACPNLLPQGGEGTRGAIYVAVRGQGTVRMPLGEGGDPVPVHVSDLADPAAARFCESFVSAHSSHDAAQAVADRLGITRESLRLDSQAKYAVVARGEADIYLRLPTRADYTERIWDHAAGTLVVEEAGGTATDVRGEPLQFRYGRLLETNRGVIATNGHLHAAVLEAVQAVGVE